MASYSVNCSYDPIGPVSLQPLVWLYWPPIVTVAHMTPLISHRYSISSEWLIWCYWPCIIAVAHMTASSDYAWKYSCSASRGSFVSILGLHRWYVCVVFLRDVLGCMTLSLSIDFTVKLQGSVYGLCKCLQFVWQGNWAYVFLSTAQVDLSACLRACVLPSQYEPSTAGWELWLPFSTQTAPKSLQQTASQSLQMMQ